ncbi:putative pyruvate dehydrogenase E1 component beta subunit [Emiliania huxleyi CCMP1516]|uniref:Lipoyl-binding domain-containing protein n=2 Tax=Emiliania huxleyi TaxID=2903 RepID=A0A0D3J6J7_EMIH1|nr:putative pyruvate dehydrogenase E1 component beta subunit [Emiliania huxleyi CCMP1516]XP_005771561.1 putative pyruvate dehydrogenase E1 component beta subunit [Emiliania huxleyi CCMP1516]EOD11591.1 putative pyruvate dehydrogenase E1 component beta subunit [Emiliania huxleyi CCMP1516]EOD19132.1 putative pyruvate dehydrogenase E1 component beta subunit [Emiliania huxleyi CCMP1516]|mmetsp:Transcript_11261/g.37218  ORF Transcript_11261/g.37218 Transcript_11261/m.37218 type:complete len:161 (-) Transcript_11261:257-739(-)|eukprot:XP_005764020.1 putative pyruvate dehydrogenase E1 component beta subunit [Emiliania huxleyi CCMP1516]
MGAARRAWPRRLCGSVRSLCSASLPPHKVVPMPRLAPTMTTGKVHQWNIGIGDAISPYDLVFQVSITGPELLGNDATEKQADAVVVMEIECIEDGFLAKILAPVGADAGPDQPIAVICEDPDDVAAFANYVPSIKKVPSGQFLWQAYLVSGLEATSCSNS